ncbi:MAG: hypothetical protein ACK5L7_10595 [Paludibacteraceae bacterium]
MRVMLMFDNAIFASFVPQFLMILGFFSCIVVPGLSQQNENPEQSSAVVAVNTVYYQGGAIRKKTVAFQVSTHKYFGEDIITPSNDNRQKQLLSPISYSEHQTVFEKTEFYSCLFSRPPPSFCF